jgi:Protein of unknown function (DUF1579)
MRPVWLRASVTLFALLAAVSLYAQMEMPAPAPELKKLDFLTGNWTAEGTMTPPGPPSSSATKWTMTTNAEWLEGSYFLVEHSNGDLGPMGKIKELAVMGYDRDRKVYTYNAFSSFGEVESATGTIDGDTWTWLSDEHMNGSTFKGRYTMKVLSPTSYTMKFEMSQDGTNWATTMEGKATKK